MEPVSLGGSVCLTRWECLSHSVGVSVPLGGSVCPPRWECLSPSVVGVRLQLSAPPTLPPVTINYMCGEL